MRKIILVGILLLFTLACNLSSVSPTVTSTVAQLPTTLPDLLASPSQAPSATFPTETRTPVPRQIVTPIPIVPIPATDITIGGVAYTAYQVPGDPFRFVCPAQCPLDTQYIYAEYAGFKLAHA